MAFADQFVERFEPWLTPDLEKYLRAIAAMFSEIELLAFDVEDAAGNVTEGWTRLFDPDLAPLKALPYLAQFVGENLPVGISEAGAREWIKDAPNRRRGTPRSIFYAAQRKLTGARLVSIRERDGGVADALAIVTYTSQTPDSAGTLADLKDVVPLDLVWTYSVLAGQVWANVATTYASWTAVAAANSSWNQLASAQVGYSQFDR